MVSEAIRALESLLPRAFHWWTDWYAPNPEWFVGGIIAVAALVWWGNSLSSRIRDGMRIIWQNRAAPVPLAGTVHDAVYAFRTHPIYLFFLNLGRWHVVPFLLAVVMVWYGATAMKSPSMPQTPWVRSAHRAESRSRSTRAHRNKPWSSIPRRYALPPA